MKEALAALYNAIDHLDCYKDEPGIKGHGAYYCVEKAIKALEKEKFVFPDDKDRGISLRDYFAGQALAGSLADTHFTYYSEVAERCYKQADAMLAEREKWGLKHEENL